MTKVMVFDIGIPYLMESRNIHRMKTVISTGDYVQI